MPYPDWLHSSQLTDSGGQPIDLDRIAFRDSYLSQHACPIRHRSPFDFHLGRPLRVIHVTTHMLQAGIDQWFSALLKYSDETRIEFKRNLVTSGFVDARQLADIGIPVEVGGRESLLRACQDCDILLVSDPGDLGPCFLEGQPPLCVFVAHGDSQWTQDRLASFSESVDHIVAISGQVEHKICTAHPSTVILNGVDAARLAPTRGRGEMRAQLGFSDDDFVLGFVGRFAEEKRPEVLLEAVSRLPEHFKVLMVGFGHLRSQLMDLANQLIPGRYTFVRGTEDIGRICTARWIVLAWCRPRKASGW